MGHSSYDPVEQGPAWNAGRKLGAKRPLKPKEIWAIRFMLDQEHRLRDRALFDLAIDSKLRGCDLVKVRIGDLVAGGRVSKPCDGHSAEDQAPRPIRAAGAGSIEHPGMARTSWRVGRQLRLSEPQSITPTISARRQYARLVDEWVTGIGLRREDYGTHSLRRTKAALIYKQTGNLRAVQILLGPHEDRKHRSISRRRYRRCFGARGRNGSLNIENRRPSQAGAGLCLLWVERGHEPQRSEAN